MEKKWNLQGTKLIRLSFLYQSELRINLSEKFLKGSNKRVRKYVST